MKPSLKAASEKTLEHFRNFATNELNHNLIERDLRGAADSRDWRDSWATCAKQGLLGLSVPQAFGGQGYSVTAAVRILEALGKGCRDNGLAIALSGQLWAINQPLLDFGTKDQKELYLPKLASGDWVGSHGLTEAESGSNALGLKCRAQRRDGGFVLNGEKVWVGMAPACDLALIFASTEPDHGIWGVSVFIVLSTDEGFVRGEPTPKMGLRTVPFGSLSLRDCWIPEDRLLGSMGSGQGIFQHTMDWERSLIFAPYLGVMERQLKACTDFSRSRQVFGNAIFENQSVSNRLAEMRIRLETCRMMLYQAAQAKEEGEAKALQSAMTKLHVSEAFLSSSLDAIRIFGGTGYASGSEIERDLRDAIGGVIYSGTSDIQRQLIANLLD